LPSAGLGLVALRSRIWRPPGWTAQRSMARKHRAHGACQPWLKKNREGRAGCGWESLAANLQIRKPCVAENPRSSPQASARRSCKERCPDRSLTRLGSRPREKRQSGRPHPRRVRLTIHCSPSVRDAAYAGCRAPRQTISTRCLGRGGAADRIGQPSAVEAALSPETDQAALCAGGRNPPAVVSADIEAWSEESGALNHNQVRVCSALQPACASCGHGRTVFGQRAAPAAVTDRCASAVHCGRGEKLLVVWKKVENESASSLAKILQGSCKRCSMPDRRKVGGDGVLSVLRQSFDAGHEGGAKARCATPAYGGCRSRSLREQWAQS